MMRMLLHAIFILALSLRVSGEQVLVIFLASFLLETAFLPASWSCDAGASCNHSLRTHSRRSHVGASSSCSMIRQRACFTLMKYLTALGVDSSQSQAILSLSMQIACGPSSQSRFGPTQNAE